MSDRLFGFILSVCMVGVGINNAMAGNSVMAFALFAMAFMVFFAPRI